ncbi:MAG: HD domain-containing phosphohydrolase [Armatimonadota bacterium]|nr:HD domain-containing phosphohydrolase [Armatimonadota bacterium]MDR7548742.1 HD domain-containing phosphohydrolase [Armatimonadota bacterium]
MTVESMLAEVAGLVDVQCPWPEGHPRRVAGYCAHLASAAALDGIATATLVRAALLHEIGKLGISEQVLRKADRLTQEEYAEVKRHPVLGAEMCRPLPDGEAIAAIVRSHHEHWNGEGYPDGLAGEAIPLGARILAIADAYDTLTMDRPWRPAYTPEEALQILWFGADTQWDPRLVELFDRVARSRFLTGAQVSNSAA